jgi:DHA1 family tetracycline resistance protein-like MFS transporter
LWLLFIGRLVDGASGASVSVAQAAVADLAPEEQRPHLFGLLGAAFGVGFVLGPAIGALAAFVGPRVPFYLAGSVALLNAVVALRRLRETTSRQVDVAAHADSAGARSTGSSAGASRALLWRLAVVAFIAMLAFSGFEATFALFGQRRFHLSLSSTGGVFTVIGLVLVGVQGGLVRPVVKRFGAEQTLRLGLGLNVVGLAALAAAHNWAVLIVALVLLVVGQGLATPTITTLVAARAGEVRRGAALGVQQAASGAARIVGPSGAGALFGHAGVAVPYAAGAGLTAAAVGLLGALGRGDGAADAGRAGRPPGRVASEVTDR